MLKRTGFTLAELLISLGILGVIATFTIPKIINSQQNGTYNSIAHETASMISGAFTVYKGSNAVTAAVGPGDLTPYMNYVSVSTSLTVDDVQTKGSYTCSSTFPCLVLHSGGVLRYKTVETFGGSNTTNTIWFILDPDGAYSGNTTGPGKALQFFITPLGRVTTIGSMDTSPSSSSFTYTPTPAYDPPWFSW